MMLFTGTLIPFLPVLSGGISGKSAHNRSNRASRSIEPEVIRKSEGDDYASLPTLAYENSLIDIIGDCALTYIWV